MSTRNISWRVKAAGA